MTWKKRSSKKRSRRRSSEMTKTDMDKMRDIITDCDTAFLTPFKGDATSVTLIALAKVLLKRSMKLFDAYLKQRRMLSAAVVMLSNLYAHYSKNIANNKEIPLSCNTSEEWFAYLERMSEGIENGKQ
jgi:hypothetical protein